MGEADFWYEQGYDAGKADGIAQAAGDIHTLAEAIRLTREYVGDRTLPAYEGWTWFDAIKATVGFDEFGGTCGCVLDPWKFGRPANAYEENATSKLFFCTLPPDHPGECGLKVIPDPTCSGICNEFSADAACPVHGIAPFLESLRHGS